MKSVWTVTVREGDGSDARWVVMGLNHKYGPALFETREQTQRYIDDHYLVGKPIRYTKEIQDRGKHEQSKNTESDVNK